MGYKVVINGEKAWESEGDVILVDKVTISNARGEVTVIGSHSQDEYLNIDVHVRLDLENPTYLDLLEKQKADARRAEMEALPQPEPPVEEVEEAPAPKKKSSKAAAEAELEPVEF